MSSNSSYVCHLSAELQEKARKELNEEPEKRAQCIAIIREWILQQPHLKARTDDSFILRFLRKCKFSLELTKERIDNFYTVRSALPEYFSNRDPLDPKMQKLMDLGIYVLLPGYDKEGRKVLLYRIGAIDPATIDITTLQKLDSLLGNLLFDDEKIQVAGISCITDISGFSASHLTLWNFQFVKQQTAIWQSCIPLRIKVVNIYNENKTYQKLFELFKVLFKEKLKKRILFHGKDMKSLHQIVPPEILPEEYGGTAGPLKNFIEQTKKSLESIREESLAEDKYGVDESKRPGKPKTKEDLFGIDGSFRKLNID